MSCEEKAVIVDAVFDTDEVEAPFGKRYGAEMLKLTSGQLQALQQGKILAVDVQNEYVLFIKLAKTPACD